MEYKISIITPVYNCEKYIEKTLETVLNQTYKNWELILVDDCSTDSSYQIIKKYINMDNRIKYYKLDKNMGAAFARNKALEKSNGRFIAYLDADDLWKKEKLEKQINYMLKNNYGFTCTSYERVDEDGTKKSKIVKMPEKVDYDFYLRNTIIQTVGVMIDTNIVNKELLIMPNIRRRQDAATWCQILKAGFICYGMNDVLSYYRIVSNSLSSNKFKAMRGTWYLYRKIEKLSLLKSVWCFFGYAFNAVRKRVNIGNEEKINFYGPIDDIQGPGIKNKNTLSFIEKEYNVKRYNTYDTTIFNRIRFIVSLIFTNRKVIIAVSTRGRNILCPILKLKKKLNPNFEYIFIIINGYIINEIEQKKKKSREAMIYVLKNSKMNFVEIDRVKEQLESKFDLDNVRVFENFKLDENYVEITDFEKAKDKDIKLVFLARVCKDKGIDTLIDVVKYINDNNLLSVTLDIYGPIFDDVKIKIKEVEDCKNIVYRGIVENKNVTKVLKNYDIYMFPTVHKREGFPATIIDAYSAALPVISSDVCFNKDIVIDGENGYIYLNNENAKENLIKAIIELASDAKLLNKMSKNNYVLSQKYRASVVLKKFMRDFNELGWK